MGVGDSFTTKQKAIAGSVCLGICVLLCLCVIGIIVITQISSTLLWIGLVGVILLVIVIGILALLFFIKQRKAGAAMSLASQRV